jgi:UPF0755 protein
LNIKKRILKKIIALTLFLLVAITGTVYYAVFTPNVTAKQEILLKQSTPADKLARKLAPYLKHSKTFILTARLKKMKTVKPGKYVIYKNMSNNDLVNMFRSGRQAEIKLTFNNIHSLHQLAETVSQYIQATPEELYASFTDSAFLRKNGFTKQTALLMYLPDTYRFYYTTTAEQFRNRMLKEYNRYWNEKRRTLAARKGLTPVEVGILASIVKKETNISREKPLIAGVYLNRLRKGMKLQADPTVVYAYRLTTGDTSIIRRVLNKHLSIDNPYNTYMYAGLPPGPIDMPDKEDLEAVLHAAQHNYLYFVADPSRPGHHLFSSNLAEHNRKARKYRHYLNQNRIKN